MIEINSDKKIILKTEDADFYGSYRKYAVDDITMIQLGNDGSAVFDLDIKESRYYNLSIRYGNSGAEKLSPIQIMIENRILATTYDLMNHINKGSNDESLGSHLILKGRHKLKLAAMCEPAECPYCLTINTTETEVHKPVFSFVLMSDVHLGAASGGVVNNLWLSEKVPEILGLAVKDINALSPNFLMLLGDIADDGRRIDDLKNCRKHLDNLRCRYHIVLGNHDTWENGRANIKEVFDFPESGKKSYYSFDFDRFHFIVLDSAHWVYEDGRISDSYNFNYKSPVKEILIPENQLEWLKRDLMNNSTKDIFIFSHAHIAPAEERPWDDGRVGPGTGTCFLNWSETLEIIDNYKNIKAVFCGHSHVNMLSKRKGVYHYQVGSMVEYPFIFRQVTVFPSHVETSVYQISNSCYSHESYIKERKNNWIGRNCDLTGRMV